MRVTMRTWFGGCLAALSCAALLAACTAQQPSSSGGTSASTADSTSATEAASTSTTVSTQATESTATESTASATETTEPTSAPADTRDAAELAKSLLGKPFKMGATGPDAFDNSGFVYYCLRQTGVDCPRFTEAMYAAGKPVEKEALVPGDLVFFYNDTPGSVDLVGLYIGGGEFVSCNNENSPTAIRKLNAFYFAEHYVGARRY